MYSTAYVSFIVAFYRFIQGGGGNRKTGEDMLAGLIDAVPCRRAFLCFCFVVPFYVYVTFFVIE